MKAFLKDYILYCVRINVDNKPTGREEYDY